MSGTIQIRSILAATLATLGAASNCPATCYSGNSCDELVHQSDSTSCAKLEVLGDCDCRGCNCGSDILTVPASPPFDYRSTGFSIYVKQFRSSDPAGDPNAPAEFSVSFTPENIATNTLPSGYTGFTQAKFEKYSWCGCSCAFEAGRKTKQNTDIPNTFGEVSIAVLGRTWQLECCVDSSEESCAPDVGSPGRYVTCTDFRSESGWTDASGQTCTFYEENNLCAGGSLVEDQSNLAAVLTPSQLTSNSTPWTTAAFVASQADSAGVDAKGACCWCGGGSYANTYESVCTNFYASNNYFGAYDGTSDVAPLYTDPLPHGYISDPRVCNFSTGCMNSSYQNYDENAVIDDSSCDLLFDGGQVVAPGSATMWIAGAAVLWIASV